jgi:hypothetical protein
MPDVEARKPGDAMKIFLECQALPEIANMLVQDFKDMGGKNYVAIEFQSDIGPLLLTMQRLEGKSPVWFIHESQGLLQRVLDVIDDPAKQVYFGTLAEEIKGFMNQEIPHAHA